MYFVILGVLVTVSARDIYQADYINEQSRHGRFDRQFVNSPVETNQRNYNVNYHSQNGPVNLNHEHFRANNGELETNQRNENANFHIQNRQVNFNHEQNGNGNRQIESNHRNSNDNYHSQNGQVNLNHEQFRANNGELETNQGNENANFHSQNRQVNLNYEQNGNYNRQFESNQRDGNGNYHSQTGQVNLNHEQFRANNDGQLIANDRRDRNYRNQNVAHVNQGRSHDNTGSIVNVAFDRQDNQNRHKHGNFNVHRQSFDNNENRNRNNSNQDRSHKYIDNILQARRQQDEMVFEGSNRKMQEDTNRENSSPTNQNNGDIITFIGKINNSKNRNEDRHNQNTNNNRRNQSSFKTTNTKDAPKTTIDNEVTLNPSQNGEAEKENRTLGKDEWVWGVVETTTVVPNVTLDDRAAFSGDKCATGMVRVMGRCVEED